MLFWNAYDMYLLRGQYRLPVVESGRDLFHTIKYCRSAPLRVIEGQHCRRKRTLVAFCERDPCLERHADLALIMISPQSADRADGRSGALSAKCCQTTRLSALYW